MAITPRAVGSWAVSNATTQTVTLPTHATGDMLIVRTIRKPFTNPDDTVINTAGWTAVATGVANGSTANGVGVGSMGFKAFYKIATSAAETNPVVTWGTTSAPGACVAISYQKGGTEYWVTPTGNGGGDATARTSQTSTIATHISVTSGDLVDFFRGQCDDSGALTVPTITQTGVTFDTVTEYPATAIADGTSNDIAADGGYRTATAGTSSAAAVVTGTSAASEQHGAWMTRLRVTTTATLELGLISQTAAIHAPTVEVEVGPYEDEVLADSPVFVLPMDEASGNLTDIVGSKTATVNGSPTYGVTGPVINHTAIDFGASTTQFFTVPDHADLDLGASGFTIELWHARDTDTGAWQVLLSKEGTAYFVAVEGADRYAFGRSDIGGLQVTTANVAADGSWHHYVLVRDAGADAAGETRIYIDGTVQTLATDSYASALSDSTSALYIGKEVAGSPAAGKIAYIALYKSALSEARIDAHYAARNVEGVLEVTLGLISQTAVASAPTITTGAVSVTPNLITQTAVIHQPTITTANAYSPALINQTAVTSNPTISVGAAPVSVGIISQTAATFTPTITTGAVSISAGFISQVAATFTPTITTANAISVALISQTAVAYATRGAATQVAYRFRYDDGDETGATWMAAQNTPVSAPLELIFRLRFEMQEADGLDLDATEADWELQYRINSGPWITSFYEGLDVESQSSAFVNDDDPTTNQLTAGTGTFSPGLIEGNQGRVTGSLVAHGHTEFEFIISLSPDYGLTIDDVVDLRIGPRSPVFSGGPDPAPVELTYAALATVTVVPITVALGLITQTAATFAPTITIASSVLLGLIDRTAAINAPHVSVGYDATVRADSPTHYWRAGEPSGSVVDSIGSANGTVSGTVTRDVVGLINATNDDGAISFAASSYVSGTLGAALPNAFTLEAWVKLPVSGTTVITYFSTKGAISNASAAVLRSGGANSNFIVKFYIYSGATYQVVALTADLAVAAGGTYHIVWTRAGTTAAQNKVYINGVDQGVVSGSTQAVTGADTTFYIGGFEGAAETWVSTLDEVAVYGTELSAARVLAHYNAGLAATQSLSPDFITQTATASAPVVSLGSAPQNLTPGLIDQTATISAPTITTTVAVTVAQITQTAATFSPTITSLATISAGLITQTAAASAPTISVGAAPISAGLITQTAATFTPTITTGAVSVSPNLITQTATASAPTITKLNSISLGLISQTAATFSPVITTGAVTVSLGLIGQGSSAFAPTVVAGVTYYISPSGNDSTGSGAIGSPWKTLGKFYSVADPGDTLYCRGGSYTKVGDGYYLDNISGTADNPITVTNYPGEVPVFHPSDGTSGTGELYFRFGSKYHVIDGLEFRGYDPVQSAIIGIGGDYGEGAQPLSGYITIRNCVFELNAPFEAAYYQTNHCIYPDRYTTDVTVEDCEFIGKRTTGQQLTGGGVHIYHDSTSTGVNTTIQRCVFKGFYKAIWIWDDDITGLIDHCTFMNCGTSIRSHAYDTIEYSNNVNNHDTTGGSFDYDIQETGGGTANAHHNYWNETLNANGSLQAGSDAIGGADDASDAGAIPYVAVQSVDLGLISQAAAASAPTVTRGAVNVSAGLITQTAQIHAATITTGAVNIAAGLITQSAVTFTPTVTATASIVVGRVTQTASTFDPTVTAASTAALGLIDRTAVIFNLTVVQQQFVTVALINQTATIHTPTISTANAISVALINQTATISTATITTANTISVALIDRTATSSAPTITTGAVAASVGLIDQTAQPRTPTITTANTVSVGLITQTAAALAPSVGTGIALGLVTQTAATFAPATTSLFTITVGQIDRTATASAPTISTGATSVSPNFINQTAVANDPTVSAGGTVVELTLTDRTAVAFAPTITTGAVSVSLGLVNQTAAISAPTTTTANAILVDLIDRTAAISTPAISTLNTVALGLINQSAVAFSPTVIPNQFVSLSLIDRTAAAFDAVISTGQIIVALPTIDRTATAQQPTVTTGAVSISLGLINRTATASTPAVLAFNTVAVGLINQSASASAPSIATGAAAMTVGRINQTAATFTPTISTGAFDLVLDLIDQPASTFEPAVSASNALLLTLINQTASALDPTITLIFDQDVTLTLINQTAVARTPYVSGGDVEEFGRELAYVGGGYYG